MKKWIGIFIILTMSPALMSISFAKQSATDEPRIEQSREFTQQLQQRLSAKLMAAMKAEGPVHAIDVCQVQAPMIASDVSSQKVDVGRTALRYRNPANAPNAQQRKVMQDFAAQLRQRPEQVPETLITLDNGEQHYMRAIVMQPQCSACHGQTIQKPVLTAIADRYPQDKATGFEVGELRGAFLVKWLADE